MQNQDENSTLANESYNNRKQKGKKRDGNRKKGQKGQQASLNQFFEPAA